MSAKERDRLKVSHEVKKRYITQKQAGAELGWGQGCFRVRFAASLRQLIAIAGPISSLQ